MLNQVQHDIFIAGLRLVLIGFLSLETKEVSKMFQKSLPGKKYQDDIKVAGIRGRNF